MITAKVGNNFASSCWLKKKLTSGVWERRKEGGMGRTERIVDGDEWKGDEGKEMRE